MEEIAKLTASCQEHEREIRASQVSLHIPRFMIKQLMSSLDDDQEEITGLLPEL
jgi:hypothetical protein